MSLYLEKIDRATEATYNHYSVNNVRLVCSDVLQNEVLTSEEKSKIKDYQKRISQTEYINIWTNEIDNSKLWEFRNLCKELWQYLHYDLGLE